MRRAGQWRPWQFSLRFLLLLTAVVAVGAAFFAWRERQLEPRRRAVARIVELGGSVEVERRGWMEAIKNGCDFEEVVSVTLPGQVAEKALPELKTLPWLRRVTMAYTREPWVVISGGWRSSESYRFIIDGRQVLPSDERARFENVKAELLAVQIGVSHGGTLVPIETAFCDWQDFYDPVDVRLLKSFSLMEQSGSSVPLP